MIKFFCYSLYCQLLDPFIRGSTITLCLCSILGILQVLAYSQKARETSMYEQAALNERMQEYKRKIDQERRSSFNGSTNGDVTQPFSRSSHKLIEAVMQSAAEGKVCSAMHHFCYNH